VGPDPNVVAAHGFAEYLIDNMSSTIEREFVRVTIDSSSFDPAVVDAAVHNMILIEAQLVADAEKNQVPHVCAPRPGGGRGRILAGQQLWKGNSLSRGSGRGKPKRRQIQSQPADTPLVLSEKNKDHLKTIAASLISDMLPAIQRLVASDPRIQRFSLSNSPRFKDKIIKEYRAELKARRKSDIALLQAAATLSKHAVSTKSFRAIRHILRDMGVDWVLPTERDLHTARGKIEECMQDDLHLYATPDGWFASMRQVVEHELDRLSEMPAEKTTRNEAGGRSLGYSGPGMHAWQDTIHCKITLDARRITKRCSVTEVMLHVFRKDEKRAADSQKALCMRTMGMWMGKDCRENVVANATRFFQECQSLQTEGVMFDSSLLMYLGGHSRFSETEAQSQAEGQAALSGSTGEQMQTEASEQAATFASSEQQMKTSSEDPIKADWELGCTMARLQADGKAKRFVHVPVKFWFPADMAAQCAVIGHGCAGHYYCAHCMAHENERHLPYELVNTTKDTSLQAMAHEYDMHARTLYAINTGHDHEKVQILTESGLRESTVLNVAALAQTPEPDLVPDQQGERRQPKKRKEAQRPTNGPESWKLAPLVGWKEPAYHPLACICSKCKISAGTCVRVIPRLGFVRPSEYLEANFKDLTAERCPFCALHCKMRVAEALFQQICQAAETSKQVLLLVGSMNDALKRAGINKKYQKNQTSKTYEKVTFEGHQVKALLKLGADGKMAIENVLDAMWPGAAEDPGVGKQYGTKFVPRTIAVWRQFAVVEKLMSERDPEALKRDIINGEDGFERFGKECREFIFRFQSMSILDYSKSYYLHTLLHHAGDFMRVLQTEGFTLGMMSNSGAERRHEYGRRASRKALASNGWRKKNSEYDRMENLIIYLTMKEVLMWDYGEDLVSYIIAKRIRDGTAVLPDGCTFSQIKSRKANSKQDGEALLSKEEALKEYDAQPDDAPHDFETSNTKFWARSGKKGAYALVGVESDPEEGSDVVGRIFDPDNELKLFDWVSLPFSHDDESDAGSEADVHDLTINDLDFGDEGEDMDESYAAEEIDEKSESWEWELETEGYQYPAQSTPALRSCPRSLTLPSKVTVANTVPVIQAEAEAVPAVNFAGGVQRLAQIAFNSMQVSSSLSRCGPASIIPTPVADDDGTRRPAPGRGRGRGLRQGRGAGAGRGASS
jgi:hypothetical protein